MLGITKWISPEFYSPTFWLQFALAVIGLAGVIAALRSLSDIKIQAKAAKDSADAALNANRSWILVESIGPIPNPFAGISADATTLLFVFHFKVFGRTPARMLESRFRFRLVPGRRNGTEKEPDLPNPPDYGKPLTSIENPEMNKTMFPEEAFSGQVTLEDSIALFRSSNLGLWKEIVKQEKFLCAYGFIKYQDAFDGAPIQETQFCYVFRITVGGILLHEETHEPVDPNGFRVGGPAGYNSAS